MCKAFSKTTLVPYSTIEERGQDGSILLNIQIKEFHVIGLEIKKHCEGSLWGYKEEDLAGGLVYIDATVAEELSKEFVACSDWFGGVGAAIVMWYRFREKVCK